MAQRSSFMDEFSKHDPEFGELVNTVRAKARETGALDQKTKTLITLALGAAGGHSEGVKARAAEARSLGASKEEIVETIRLTFLVSGIPGLVAGMAAFQE